MASPTGALGVDRRTGKARCACHGQPGRVGGQGQEGALGGRSVQWTRLGLTLLIPTQFAFALLALLAVLGVEGVQAIGGALAVAGTLSLLGLIVLVLVTWKSQAKRLWVASGTATALLGHYVVDLFAPSVAPSMIYLGTGIVAGFADRRTAIAGAFAAAGAALREVAPSAGNLLLAIGAAALGVLLILVVRNPMEDDAGDEGAAPEDA